MDRRAFVAGCVASAGVAFARARLEAAESANPYPRVPLLDSSGGPFTAGALPPHEAHCFFYPYVSTPCLLLNMQGAVAATEPVPGDRRPGGVGPAGSIVAYTAICPHEWNHPEPEFSPIRYVAPGDRAVLAGEQDRLIVCCSHGSVFDPATGGRVAQSPARAPLASIVLDWDEASDRLFATGISGPVSFEPFFAAFKRDRRAVSTAARVMRLDRYSKVVGRC